MKDKILKEALEWYSKQDDKKNIFIEDFVNLVINKTADALFEEVQEGFKEEFYKGNLKHPFIISSDYYLYLKLKEIKNNLLKTIENTSSDEEITTQKNEKLKENEK
jgi:hypothetical protein